jgi:hypothetical protein
MTEYRIGTPRDEVRSIQSRGRPERETATIGMIKGVDIPPRYFSGTS